MQDQRILISGIAGSVGSELARQLYKSNVVSGFDINETELFLLAEDIGIDVRIGDIKNSETLKEIVEEFNPDVVFHTAALKHVSPSMTSPREYVETNLIGTLNFLKATKGVGKFINISSDKAVQNQNVMGWTKKGTELFTRIYGGISVRFGNVMGSRGSVIPIWQSQIESRKPLTVTDPRAERYMMTMEEAVSLVIKAGEKGNPGEIICLDMGKRINILDLAKKILERSESDLPIEMIGLRPGEVLVEEIMTPNELASAKKDGRFYVLI